jgi:hypothetical protein
MPADGFVSLNIQKQNVRISLFLSNITAKAGGVQSVDKKLFAQIFRYLAFGNCFPLPCYYRPNRTEYNKKSSRISTALSD